MFPWYYLKVFDVVMPIQRIDILHYKIPQTVGLAKLVNKNKRYLQT